MKRRIFLKQSSAGIGGLLSVTTSKSNLKNINQSNTNMSTKRMNSFDVPHKGIRNGLSQLSLFAGKTDYADKAEVAKLYTLGKEVFEILTTHANDENDVSLKALEDRLKGSSHHDIEEHIRIHVAQSKLEDFLKQIHSDSIEGRDASEKGATFYAMLSDFHADYLRHMAEEEKETQVLLWQHFTDEELAQHRAEIMKKLKPETLLLWLKFIVPAQSHKEKVGLLSNFKAMAPSDFFKRAMDVIKNAISPDEWNALHESLH